jgi:hypothetical protein
VDGGRKDILRWVSHGPEGDIIDDYTTLPWATLCAEVAKLRISLREGRGPDSAKSLNFLDQATLGIEPSATVLLQTHRVMKKLPSFKNLGAFEERGVRDLKPINRTCYWP